MKTGGKDSQRMSEREQTKGSSGVIVTVEVLSP